MGGRTQRRKKSVSLRHIDPDVLHELKEKWGFELDMRKVPEEMKSYFAALHMARKNHIRGYFRAAGKWASKAYERLMEARNVLPQFESYLEPFDLNEVDENAESLPLARTRQRKAAILEEVLKRNAC